MAAYANLREKTMQYDNFDCEVADGCATVRLTGPGAPDLGALCDEFVDLVLRLQEDRAARVILLVDGDHAFDLHRDLDGLADARRSGSGFEQLAAEDAIARRIVTLVAECPKPVVAATRGEIRNVGLGLYLAADIRVAGEGATFTAPDMSGGLVGGWGLALTLPRLLGPGRALDFLWSHRTLGAAEAERIGLVDRLLPEDQWEQELFALTRRLSRIPQPALHLTKLAVQQAPALDLTSMLAMEWESQQQCWDSDETSEGLRALAEGREPRLEAATSPEED
jgi:2-(1,2-epoxy-1,2-dihydrophenyl)acetyl-CoA isomerase